MKKLNFIVIFLMVLSIFYSYKLTTVLANDEIMYVNAKSDIILREKPAKDAKHIGKVKNNSKVVVLSKMKEWAYIQSNKQKGYVYLSALSSKENLENAKSELQLVKDFAKKGTTIHSNKVNIDNSIPKVIDQYGKKFSMSSFYDTAYLIFDKFTIEYEYPNIDLTVQVEKSLKDKGNKVLKIYVPFLKNYSYKDIEKVFGNKYELSWDYNGYRTTDAILIYKVGQYSVSFYSNSFTGHYATKEDFIPTKFKFNYYSVQ